MFQKYSLFMQSHVSDIRLTQSDADRLSFLIEKLWFSTDI